MDIPLLRKFEQALQSLYDTLERSKQEYSILFSSMIAGEDITKELQYNTCNILISQARQQLHTIQKKLSEILLQKSNSTVSDSILSITDISEKVADHCNGNIVAIAKKCICLYEEIRSITYGIGRYYEHKISEYQNFFDRVYEELYTNKGYTIQDKKNCDSSGLLVYKNV